MPFLRFLLSRFCLAGLAALGAPLASAQTPPSVVTRPLEVWWGGYKGSQQLVDGGATQWNFVRQNMDGFILHGAYWNYSTNTFGAPSPDVVGPKLATLLNEFSKPVIVEHLLAGEYPDIDSAFGTAFAGNVSDPAAFGSAIANIKRLQNYGFPRPDVSSDFIMNSWQEAVRFHPEWTSKEFFTALTGAWETYDGTQFDPAPGSADRLRYGWFRQWVERLAAAFPGIKVTATNSPVYLPWTDAGDTRRELGGSLNHFYTWLKLERRGDTVNALYSGDGFGWAPLGSATVPLGASPRAGLYVSSADPARLAQARFTDVRVLPVFTADIGKTGRGGTISVSGSTYTLTGRGNDFTHPGNNTSDAQFFAWRDWSGDGTFTVRLDSLVGSNPARTNPAGELPTAGLTLRESSAVGARQVSLHANLANQLEFLARTSTNGGLAAVSGSGSPLASLGVASAPRWLRLTRSGNTLTAAHSPDGVTWTTLAGSASVAFPAAIQVGLVADSQVRFETATAVFSNVSFLTAPAVTFSGADVGAAGAGAASSLSGSTYTLKAAGSGIATGATGDALRLHSTAWSGDGTLIARLEWFADDASPATALSAAAQMGLTLRTSTAADAAAVAIAFTPQQGLRTFARTASAAAVTNPATYGVGEVSIQPLGANYRPLLHYFTGNAYLAGLHEAFPVASAFHDNYAGFTTDSPYGDYQKWGGSETHPDALRHRRKIILYERWLQDRGRVHDFIANSTGGDFSGFNTATQTGRDAWDLLYKQHSLRSLQLHQLEGGRADKVYLESWYDGPFTLVPESQNGTFANLVRDAIYYVKGLDQTLALTALTPTTATPAAMGAPVTYTVRLQNTGTVPALPVLQAFESGGSGWSATYTLNATDVTAAITSATGLPVTDAALYSANELINAGASVDLTVTLTPNAATAPRSILLRAFWNPQDPSAAVRSSITLSASAPTQLLANGFAEAGSTSGWISNGGGSVSLDTTVFRSGTASIRGNRSQTYQGPAQNVLGRLLPGQTYRLTAWTRVSTGTPSVKATLAYTGTTGSAIFNSLQIVAANATGWTPVDVTFRYLEPNGPATALVLYFEGPPAGTSLYIDDASLVLLPPVWTQTAAGIQSWTTAANWSSNQPPASSSLIPVAFFTGQTLPAGNLTSTQNSATPFQTSALTLAGAAPASGNASITLAGQTIETTALTLAATGPSLAYTVTTALSSPTDFFVTGDGTASYTLTAPLSGNGSLTKSGNATLALTAANTFTGGTTVAAGTLSLGNATALGSGPVTLSGGALSAAPSSNPTLANPLVFAADTTLTGNLTFSGPAQLSLANRILTVPSGAVTLSGILSDDAARNLTKAGPGTLVLSAANTYRGSTTLSAGALRVTHPAALGNSTAKLFPPGGAALAALELAGEITVNRPVELAMHNTVGHAQLRNASGNNTFSAALTLNGGGARWEITSLAGNLTVSGPVSNIVSGTDTWRTLYLNGPAAGAFTGTVAESPTSKLNLTVVSGAWSLSGPAKTYTGPTFVTGGSLRADTALASAVTVQSGATFAGSGSTSSTLTIQTGATFSTRLTDWNALPSAFSAAQLIATGATSWTVRLDASGLANFSESARTVPLVSTSGGLVNVAPASITLVPVGFPGLGTFSFSTSGNSLALVYAPNLYAAWTAGVAWGGANSAPTADPDADGLPNLLEYALGGTPTNPSSAPLPTLQVNGVSPQPTYLQLTFTRLADPALTYEAQASADLITWDTPFWSSTGAANLAGSVTVTDPTSLSGNPRRFVRLRVTR